MNKLILFAAFCFTSLFFSNCNKNDNPPPSYSDYIIKSSWKFDKAMSNGADVSGFLSACYKDNIMTFTANGMGTFDEGATKCNSGDPQTTNFTWNFTSNGSVLNVSAGIIAGQSGSFPVIALDDNKMVLEATITAPSGSVTGQAYFKH
jgi:hypothetical protein